MPVLKASALFCAIVTLISALSVDEDYTSQRHDYIPDDYMCDETKHTLPDEVFEALCRGSRKTGVAIVFDPGSDLWCDELNPVRDDVTVYDCLCNITDDCDRKQIVLDIKNGINSPCNSTDECAECDVTLTDEEYERRCNSNRRALYDDDADWWASGHIIAVNAGNWAIFHHHTAAGIGGATKYGLEFLKNTNYCEKTNDNRPYIRRSYGAAQQASMYYGIPTESNNNRKSVIHVHSVRMGEFRVKGTWKANEQGGATCLYVSAWPYIRVIGPGELSGCGLNLWSLEGQNLRGWRQNFPNAMSYWASTGSSGQPCQDWDCTNRLLGCPAMGCNVGTSPTCVH